MMGWRSCDVPNDGKAVLVAGWCFGDGESNNILRRNLVDSISNDWISIVPWFASSNSGIPKSQSLPIWMDIVRRTIANEDTAIISVTQGSRKSYKILRRNTVLNLDYKVRNGIVPRCSASVVNKECWHLYFCYEIIISLDFVTSIYSLNSWSKVQKNYFCLMDME